MKIKNKWFTSVKDFISTIEFGALDEFEGEEEEKGGILKQFIETHAGMAGEKRAREELGMKPKHLVELKKKLPMFPAPTPLFPDVTDEGKCITLHQPWASLIVQGFKR